jgi:hypothetical protein
VISAELAALHRILVIKLSSLGDIVHVTPCLRALRRACPAARITMAVDRRFVALVRGSPYLDEMIEADAVRVVSQPGSSRGATSRGTAGRPSISRWIPGNAPERPLGLRERSESPAGPAAQSGGPRWRPGWQRVVRPDQARHAVRVYAAVAEAIGVPVEDLDPELYRAVRDALTAETPVPRIDAPVISAARPGPVAPARRAPRSARSSPRASARGRPHGPPRRRSPGARGPGPIA